MLQGEESKRIMDCAPPGAASRLNVLVDGDVPEPETDDGRENHCEETLLQDFFKLPHK